MYKVEVNVGLIINTHYKAVNYTIMTFTRNSIPIYDYQGFTAFMQLTVCSKSENSQYKILVFRFILTLIKFDMIGKNRFNSNKEKRDNKANQIYFNLSFYHSNNI